ncbi:MAG: hypothetical protein AB7O39_11200 [Flavobacteriaceae bacterium]
MRIKADAFPARILAVFALLLAVTLGACSDVAPPAPSVGQPAGPIAFEPVTGLPDSKAAELAAALGQRAASRNLVVVSRDDPKLRYKIKGYFSAHASTERSSVSFIWDVFDKNDARVHRFEGTQQAPATGASDPWGSVSPEAIDSIADATTAELARFLSSVGAQASVEPPSGTALGYAASQPPDAPVAPRFFISVSESNVSDAQTALPAALAAALSAHGATVVERPEEANIIVSAATTISPVDKGRQTVAIIWTAEEAGGRGLGSVRQVSRVLGNTLDHGWGVSAQQAAEAAAPALLQLVVGS